MCVTLLIGFHCLAFFFLKKNNPKYLIVKNHNTIKIIMNQQNKNLRNQSLSYKMENEKEDLEENGSELAYFTTEIKN